MKKTLYWKLSLFCFAFFFCWLVFFAFLPIWFGQVLHLTGTQIGIIYGTNSVFTMAIQPCYGYVSDRLGMKKTLLYFLTAVVACTGPFFIYLYGPLLSSLFYVGVLVGALFLSLAFFAGCAVIESFIEKAGRIVGFEFGRARMWGSLGAAAGVFCAGRMFNADPNLIFWMASAGAVVMLAVLVTVRVRTEEAAAVKAASITLADVRRLFKMKDVWIFMVFILGSACVYSVFDQQFAIYYASLFPTVQEGNAMFGYLNSFQIFLEAGGMCAAPWIVNRIGAKNGLVLAGAIMTFRMVGSGLASDPYAISVIKLLHALELAILLVAVFKYLARNFDTRLSSVLYLVGYQFSNQLGQALLSPFVGVLYDLIGFRHTYLILGAIVGCFTLLGACMLLSAARRPAELNASVADGKAI